MPAPAPPERSDYLRSTGYLLTYLMLISISAFWLLVEHWLIWSVIVITGASLLVNWHRRATVYRCPGCEHLYRISFLGSLLAPHGLNRQGPWLLLRCPRCGERRRTPVLKIDVADRQQ